MVHSIEIAVSTIFTVISHCYQDSLPETQIIFNIPEHPDIMALPRQTMISNARGHCIQDCVEITPPPLSPAFNEPSNYI